jgi:hypothetical protein
MLRSKNEPLENFIKHGNIYCISFNVLVKYIVIIIKKSLVKRYPGPLFKDFI